ncbi:MAG: hypothetical protein LBE92_17885 [Chryseobacterium sp.]|jgi:hypothetical protein|uniref:hypothetical protein n=1 Tax=Chryseobacterium sp. TaxID=1871047 RepID=UPI00282F96E5|nr:hypothetical protein [Chryseobacterium sp.]MDR2237996.1 hypothetical protein [Chryseobacterium sp.]
MIITKLHIVDWYDDMITSIISFGKETYIFNCIQKYPVNGEKTYYCVKIDEESFKQIGYIIDKKSLSTTDWNILNSTFEKNNKIDHVFLLKTKSMSVGSDIRLDKVKNSDIINIELPFDISTLYFSFNSTTDW